MIYVSDYYYENLDVGDIIKTNSKYITSAEIELITSLIGATNPIFLNSEVARQRGFKDKITPGALISAYAFGLEYQTKIYDHIIALLQIDEMKFKAPLFHGDPLRSELEVIQKRDTSRKDRGIIVFQRRCFVNEKEIMSSKLTFLYLKRKD